MSHKQNPPKYLLESHSKRHLEFSGCNRQKIEELLVTYDLIIVFQPLSRPYSDQLIGLVPHTQHPPPILMDLNSFAVNIYDLPTTHGTPQGLSRLV